MTTTPEVMAEADAGFRCAPPQTKADQRPAHPIKMSAAAPAIISEATLTALGATFRDIKIDNTVGKDATVELALTNDDGHVFGNLKTTVKADHTVHVDSLTFVDHAAHGDVARAVAGVFHHVGADGLLSAFLEAQRRSAVLYAAEKSAHHTTGDAAHPVFKYGEAAHARALLQVDGMLDKAHKTTFINHTASHIGLKGGLFFSGHLILVLLEGTGKKIQQYLNLATSTPCDIDGSGKKVKETGLHVLYEAETATAGAAAKFEVHHGVTAADLAKTLKEDFAIPAATLHAIPHLAAHA